MYFKALYNNYYCCLLIIISDIIICAWLLPITLAKICFPYKFTNCVKTLQSVLGGTIFNNYLIQNLRSIILCVMVSSHNYVSQKHVACLTPPPPSPPRWGGVLHGRFTCIQRISQYQWSKNCLACSRLCKRREGASERNKNESPLVFVPLARTFVSLAEPGTG